VTCKKRKGKKKFDGIAHSALKTAEDVARCASWRRPTILRASKRCSFHAIFGRNSNSERKLDRAAAIMKWKRGKKTRKEKKKTTFVNRKKNPSVKKELRKARVKKKTASENARGLKN